MQVTIAEMSTIQEKNFVSESKAINTGVALGKSDKVKAKIDGAYQHKETANQQNNIALKVTHTRVVGGKAADGNSRKGMANSIEG
jgi:hypothetical protein